MTHRFGFARWQKRTSRRTAKNIQKLFSYGVLSKNRWENNEDFRYRGRLKTFRRPLPVNISAASRLQKQQFCIVQPPQLDIFLMPPALPDREKLLSQKKTSIYCRLFLEQQRYSRFSLKLLLYTAHSPALFAGFDGFFFHCRTRIHIRIPIHAV